MKFFLKITVLILHVLFLDMKEVVFFFLFFFNSDILNAYYIFSYKYVKM